MTPLDQAKLFLIKAAQDDALLDSVKNCPNTPHWIARQPVRWWPKCVPSSKRKSTPRRPEPRLTHP